MRRANLIVRKIPEATENATEVKNEQDKTAIDERSKHGIAEFFKNNEHEIDVKC